MSKFDSQEVYSGLLELRFQIHPQNQRTHWKPVQFINLLFQCLLSILKVKSSMAKSFPVENLLPQNVGSTSTTCSNLLMQPNRGLLVAVNHNQQRTMASETVDPIDWSHPQPHGQYPLSPRAQYKSVQHQPGIDPATFSMRSNHLAYAATQGGRVYIYKIYSIFCADFLIRCI